MREADAGPELEVDEREGCGFGRGCAGLGILEEMNTK